MSFAAIARWRTEMDNDFETMPIGTAVLLRELGNWLRGHHKGVVDLHGQYAERASQATGWRRDQALEEIEKLEALSNDQAEQIGKIEALLDRCPHAPPLEVGARSIPWTEVKGI
jgi:hypothetical protein